MASLSNSLLLLCLFLSSFGHVHLSSLSTILNALTEKRFQFDHRHFDRHEMCLYPDIAFPSLTEPNTWKVMIHGWRYQSNGMKNLVEFAANLWIERLADHLLSSEEMKTLNQSIDHDRLKPFFVEENSNEAISIRIGNVSQEIRTDHNGEFYQPIDVTTDQIKTLKEDQNSNRVLSYEAMGYDGQVFNGSVHLVESTNDLSIISDIDDTIKISEVLDKIRLLTNTFILPFKPVPGMAELYRNWSKTFPNCTFHYLSAMPDQLYTLTEEFLRQNHFPMGSFHMRHFDWAIHSLFQFIHSQSTFDHKLQYLNFFFTHLRRQFILVGDSGEKDPEIYGIIARTYPQSIRKIFIRAVQDESFTDQRFLDAFNDIPREKWAVFNDPSQISLD